jgi:hypothetical protein
VVRILLAAFTVGLTETKIKKEDAQWRHGANNAGERAAFAKIGAKAPFDYSVFTAASASAAFLLFALRPVKSTVECDAMRRSFPEKQ